LKKLNSSDAKEFSSVIVIYIFALKARLWVLKFQFCQLKLMWNHEKLAI